MTRAAALAVLAGAAIAAQAPAREPRYRVQPDPASVVAAEIAFARLAQEKGQWTAFRATADESAVMFVPEKVLARDWLKKRADPPRAVRWQAQRVWVSCDGRTAASTGPWQRSDGSQGYFTTIWKRDAGGTWKWVLDHGDVLKTPRPDVDAVEGHVATCKGRPPSFAPIDDRGRPRRGEARQPYPADESLIWTYDVRADGGRSVVVKAWDGDQYDVVIDDRVAPEKTG